VSNEAITWALTRPIKHSTAKFVLVVLANCADNDSWLAWPSVAHLSESTGQDRKTVIENLRRLQELGFISDSGMRKGSTGQVPVYKLNSTETGTVKESQKRNSTETGTVPKFLSNSTEIPYKESRFSAQTVPKTGHGTIKETSKETSGKPNKKEKSGPDGFDPIAFLLNATVDEQTARDWLQHRKAKKASFALTVLNDRVKQAALAGIPLVDALAMEVSRGWQGFEASWLQPKQARASPSGLGKAGQATAAAAQRLLERARLENEQTN
jgi:hypothetical protein